MLAPFTPSLLPLSIVEAPAVEGVYLLAFLHKGEHVAYGAMPGRPHAGALHYAGWAPVSIADRVREHATGRGSRLTLAAFLAGYELRLVRVWAHAGRDVERRLKDRHNLARVCPLCKYALSCDPIPLDVSRQAAPVELLNTPCEVFRHVHPIP